MKKSQTKNAPSVADATKARTAAEASAAAIAKMTPGERAAKVKEIEQELSTSAPTLAAAESDLLKMLQLVGAEFVRRYYPDADAASFEVGTNTGSGKPRYWVHIPVPVAAPAAESTVS